MSARDWCPNAIRDPGLNAGYRRGVATMQLDVEHFTVGTDSRALIRNKGLAAFLFPKVGRPWQFCEANAVTSHACEWNRLGPGREFERMSWNEPLTPDQIHWGGVVAHWLNQTYGIPLNHHGGARLPIGSGFRGFVNHGSLVHRACDQHTDGVTEAEFVAMVGTPAPIISPSLSEVTDMAKVQTWKDQGGAQHVVHVNANGAIRHSWQGPPVNGKWSFPSETIPGTALPDGDIGIVHGFHEAGRVDLFIESPESNKVVHAWQKYGGNPGWGSELIG